MWVDRMVLPLGSVIVIGLVAGLLLTTGAPSTTKCPVAPESDIAHATLATNFLVDTFFHSTFPSLNNARRALCLVGAVMGRCLYSLITTRCSACCTDAVLFVSLLQFDITAVASSSSSSSYINAAYELTLFFVVVGISGYVSITFLVLLYSYVAAPTCHACHSPGLAGSCLLCIPFLQH